MEIHCCFTNVDFEQILDSANSKVTANVMYDCSMVHGYEGPGFCPREIFYVYYTEH